MEAVEVLNEAAHLAAYEAFVAAVEAGECDQPEPESQEEAA